MAKKIDMFNWICRVSACLSVGKFTITGETVKHYVAKCNQCKTMNVFSKSR